MVYNVLICDDQTISRQLFESIVTSSENFNLIKSLDSAKFADIYCAGSKIDLVLMDIVMKDGFSGLDAAAIIKEKYPDVKIIILTSMPEATYIEKAKSIGVESFWYKEVQDAPLLEIMNRTMAGENIYPSSAPVVSLGLAVSTEFTDREIDVLRELVSGYNDHEIAEHLFVSFSTVRFHINNMLEKTGFDSRTELAIKAVQCGIVVPE